MKKFKTLQVGEFCLAEAAQRACADKFYPYKGINEFFDRVDRQICALDPQPVIFPLIREREHYRMVFEIDDLPLAKVSRKKVTYLDTEDFSDAIPYHAENGLIRTFPVIVFRYQLVRDEEAGYGIMVPKFDYQTVNSIPYLSQFTNGIGYGYSRHVLRQKVIVQNGFKIHHPSCHSSGWQISSHATYFRGQYEQCLRAKLQIFCLVD